MIIDDIVAKIAAKIAADGFVKIMKTVATDYTKKTTRNIPASLSDIENSFGSHLKNTFNKCMQVKTILDRASAANTLKIYVEQSFFFEGKSIDQITMDESIRNGTSTIIIGEGGGGKSMFMKYLWLSYFERPNEKIPFFLELRNLNNLSHKSISAFIFHSIIRSEFNINEQNFEASLRAGEFILFLDGFDEVNLSDREWVQSQILNLQEDNPNLTIVMTSRPDERFMGWQGFKQAQVLNLSKKTSKQLIQKANCDEKMKRKFLKNFDKLYSEHESFMSNPLLAYMMLVSFLHNPDIPTKMFRFYEQSFDALYHLHDLTKDYTREFHTKDDLDKEKFIRLTSLFCLITYQKQTLEFSRSELLSVVNNAKEFETTLVDANAFVDDLLQSVCILKLDGLSYTFTHRSFQEYFAAYCITRVAVRDYENLVAAFSRRFGDKVLPMVADTNPDFFREKYLIPNHKKFKYFIDRKGNRSIAKSFAHKVGIKFIVFDRMGKNRAEKKHQFQFHLDYQHEKMSDFYRTINAINTMAIAENDSFVSDKLGNEAFVDTVRAHSPFSSANLRVEFNSKNIEFIFLQNTYEPFQLSPEGEEVAEPEIRKILHKVFLNSDMNRYLEYEALKFTEYVKSEVSKHKKVDAAFLEFLN